jgi:hypothetical protein
MKKIIIKKIDIYEIEGSIDPIIEKVNKLKLKYPDKELFIDWDYERVPYTEEDQCAVIKIYYKEDE